ncbi:MAG: pyridoxal phosphate-dependent transferase [Olpidium bornovanus]|uniref:acetylornithine transaminase n=1 Tax=Olpidium bornovanus TaxID=278681 RepID=A0A8H8DLZ2_9FUNG|nr:MAG: pyridoxal phosphate-dependent transferase [Olpidium bornovanus]
MTVDSISSAAGASSYASKATNVDDKLTHADSDSHPDTRAIIDEHEKVLLGTYARVPLVFTHGRGCYMYDLGGRKFLDFAAGIAVNALGHADAGVAEMLADQAGRLVHTSNLFHHKPAGDLAALLVNSTGGAGAGGVLWEAGGGALGATSQDVGNGKDPLFKADKVFFTNSGTEANEGALKFARKAGKVYSSRHMGGKPKFRVVCFSNAFHGRSMGALSATPKRKYQEQFEPLVPGFVTVPFNDSKAAAMAIDDSTCAVIVEPVQGEGGVHAATEDFLSTVRQRCDDAGALLIFDEIQCGLGRTGKLWAFENFPPHCQPDIVTIAKPLGNGVPIGAVLLNKKAASDVVIGKHLCALFCAILFYLSLDPFHSASDRVFCRFPACPGDHGTTFGGNPLACRVAEYVFRRISDPFFLSHVRSTGDALRSRLARDLSSSPLVVDVRGRGLMVGVEFRVDPAPLVKIARERGLIIITAGSNTVRIVPPLILSPAEAEEGAEILLKAVKEFEKISGTTN